MAEDSATHEATGGNYDEHPPAHELAAEPLDANASA